LGERPDPDLAPPRRREHPPRAARQPGPTLERRLRKQITAAVRDTLPTLGLRPRVRHTARETARH
jgi:hypothetical protein